MAEMTEAKIYEALGLEVPAAADTGAKEQGIADPVQTQDNTVAPEGERAQEIADPAEDGTEPTAGTQREPDPEEPDTDSGAEAGNPPQTPEERRANAARRRQQEQQQAVETAVAAARREEQEKAAAEIRELFEKTGLKNTLTGKPITSIEEMRAWQQEVRRQQMEKDLKAGKLTPEALNQLIGEHPAVQAAARMAEQEPGEAARTQGDGAAVQARIEGELAEIGRMDPTIKSAADLMKMPKAKEFYSYVQKGCTFLEAYRLTHFEEITQRSQEAARQQAQASARSKAHLKTTGNSRSTGAATVPTEQMQLYRMLNPGISEAEIQNHFNKYQNKGG